jgi:hypothetical protein
VELVGNYSNPHVARLNRYQPIDADFNKIYFEGDDHLIDLSTRAFFTLVDQVRRPDVSVVVLTGDAGHGKTHLCAKLLAELSGATIPEVAELINEGGYGKRDLFLMPDGRPLRIIKDLSEVPPILGAELLSQAIDADAVTVICANEGRLRSCLTIAGLKEMLGALQNSILNGRGHGQSSPHVIINLNHQSVSASETHPPAVDQLFDAWLLDESNWSVCEGCPANEQCPIYWNRTELAGQGALSESRRDAIRLLLGVVERIGFTVTIRELLIAVSHFVTGGIDCAAVQRMVQEQVGNPWQVDYSFATNVFGRNVTGTSMDEMQVFRGLRKLDPALVAIRDVDDRLDPESQQDRGKYGRDNESGMQPAPNTTKGRAEEAEKHREIWHQMRRRGFFQADYLAKAENGPPDARDRLGFLNVREFEAVAAGEEVANLKHRLLRGLEAIQGVQRSVLFAPLVIVDPAFTTSLSSQVSGSVALPSTTSIVAVEIPLANISIKSEHDSWIDRSTEGQVPTARDDVDWLDRRIILSLDPHNADLRLMIDLRLHEFEYLLRASEGLQSRQHFAPTIQSILRRLARVVAASQPMAEVVLYRSGRRVALHVDGSAIHKVDN